MRVTQAAGDAFATAAGSGGRFDIVVCVGGDGTLNEVTNGLMAVSDRPRLGYIPCGSTNDFASSLRLPKRPLDAARKIPCRRALSNRRGQVLGPVFQLRRILRRVHGKLLCRAAVSEELSGPPGLYPGGIKDLPRIRPYYVRVTVNNRTFEDEYIFGGVTNTLSMGGILKLDRLDVSLSDGVFEIILVKNPVNAVEVQKIVSSLTRQQFDTDLIEIFRADRAEFEMDEPPRLDAGRRARAGGPADGDRHPPPAPSRSCCNRQSAAYAFIRASVLSAHRVNTRYCRNRRGNTGIVRRIAVIRQIIFCGQTGKTHLCRALVVNLEQPVRTEAQMMKRAVPVAVRPVRHGKSIFMDRCESAIFLFEKHGVNRSAFICGESDDRILRFYLRDLRLIVRAQPVERFFRLFYGRSGRPCHSGRNDIRGKHKQVTDYKKEEYRFYNKLF